MARHSVCGVVVPHCGESDCRPLAALGAGGTGRFGENRIRTSKSCARLKKWSAGPPCFAWSKLCRSNSGVWFVLRFVEQKSIKEVAREIRKTEGAVKQLQFRALSSLRARMEGADA